MERERIQAHTPSKSMGRISGFGLVLREIAGSSTFLVNRGKTCGQIILLSVSLCLCVFVCVHLCENLEAVSPVLPHPTHTRRKK